MSIHRLILVWPLVLIACDTYLEPYDQPPGRVAVAPHATHTQALTAIDSCDALLEELRAREIRAIRASIDANREYALRVVGDTDGECYDPNAGGCFFPFLCGSTVLAADVDDRGVNEAPTAQPEASEARDYTTTNNQVGGVDEADFVKNDAEYVYVTADDQLLIFDAWPAENLEQLASVTLTGEPERIFLDGDRLVVLADTGDPLACGWDPYYGSFSNQSLEITVWDISDKSSPALERRTQVSGTYVAARLIDGVVHTVVEFAGVATPLVAWPTALPENLCNDGISKREVNAAFDQLLADNLAAAEELSIAHFLPGIIDEDLVAGSTSTIDEELFAACEDFYAADGVQSEGYLSLLSFPTDNDAVMGATTVLGRFGEVYASRDNLYVAVNELAEDPGDDWEWGWGSEQTRVHKFALGAGGAAATYAGSGTVPGVIINQFAMDEHENRLRIATTAGWTENNLFILEEDHGELSIVGEVRDLAPGETIRAVRFAGDRGYVVTFQQVDPLFTFDLSDPYAPRVLGDLHIPGFSTYIHFMDPDHLLTIGFDATNDGFFQGVMLQVFDVTDMASPILSHREVIGTRGTMSDATADHLAFTYFKSRDLLAIPMAICSGYETTFNGLLVYEVSADNGFRKLGGVDHSEAATSNPCGDWWENPDSLVKRSIFMEDYVISLSNTRLKVNHLDNLGSPLRNIVLPASNWYSEAVCRPTW